MDTSETDAFLFCSRVLLDESKKADGVLLTEKHCCITDTKDADFNKVENRLAYLYKFGYINTLFVENCISKYFDEYLQSEKICSIENLKICSLSNVPGIDIVGFLCALNKGNKRLNSFPTVKSINVYNSWEDIYRRITSDAYRQYSMRFNSDYVDIPSENIQLIECDIFSSWPLAAQDCIKDCDILFMVRTFASTKATPLIVASTLKHILSLIKPGAVIFFIGNKKNITEIENLTGKLVDIIFGPTSDTVTVKDLPVNERLFKTISSEPCLSVKAKFIVLQKKITSEEHDISSQVTEKQKTKRKKKKKNLAKVKVVPNELSQNGTTTGYLEKEDSDVDSVSSLTSCSKQSDMFPSESKNGSCENIFQPMFKINSAHSLINEQSVNFSFEIENGILKKSMSLPEKLKDKGSTEEMLQESTSKFVAKNTSNLDKQKVKGSEICKVEKIRCQTIDPTDLYKETERILSQQSTCESNTIPDIQNFHHTMTNEVCKVENELPPQSTNSINPCEDFVRKMSQESIFIKNVPDLENQKTWGNETCAMQKNAFQTINPLNPKINTADANIKKVSKQSESQFENKSISLDKVKPQKPTKETSFSKMLEMLNSLDIVNNDEIKNINVCETKQNKSKKSSEKPLPCVDSSLKNLVQNVGVTLDISEKSIDRASTKISINACGNNVISTQNCITTHSVKESSIVNLNQQKESHQKILKERLQQCTNKIASLSKELDQTENQDVFNSTLQRCETLVSSLEKLVKNIQSGEHLLNKEPLRKCCSRASTCPFVRNPHSNTSCSMSQSCYQKYCNCRVMHNHACPKSECYKTCINEIHTSNFDNARNPTPYLIIPIQNNLPDILTFISSS